MKIDVEAQRLKKLLDSLEKGQETWKDHWYDVTRYSNPRRDDVYTFSHKTPGDRKNLHLYDSFAVHCVDLSASNLHSMLTNMTSKWFFLTSGDPLIDRVGPVRKYLQDVTETTHSVINNSNFHSAIHPLYLDLPSLGTGVFRVDEDKESIINFTALPIFQCGIAEDHTGRVIIVGVTYEMTAEQIILEFGEKKIPAEVLKKFKKDLERKYEIGHIVMPKQSADLRTLDTMRKPFVSYKFLKEPCVTLSKKGFSTHPYMVPRWEKLTGELYGRSPAMKSLPDIKMINQMKKVTIRGAQKAIDPPIAVPDDSILGAANMRPGGQNPYRADRPESRIYPIVTGARVDIGQDVMNEVKQQIKENFFLDQLQLRDGDRMTTREVDVREDQGFRFYGPILGRFHFEFLQPLIARVVDICQRKGVYDQIEVPEEMKGRNPRVFFASEIARAQRAGESMNVVRFFQTLGPYAEMDPDILKNINKDELVKYVSDLNSLPEVIFHSEKELKKMRQEEQAQQQEMMEVQKQREQATAANQAAGAVQKIGG
jgi:hypothetical protein